VDGGTGAGGESVSSIMVEITAEDIMTELKKRQAVQQMQNSLRAIAAIAELVVSEQGEQECYDAMEKILAETKKGMAWR